ncbi:hypothetical protein BJX68DRAFT_265589 [Aspergillus pseudodeflectus]|uniref:Extracellular membrane protein CFEM domain-containing protein n=1 Tax=Aspergillus pseudodeflectus TaxID=176178 RepID=A0ABR4KKA4_9EURO
MHFSPATLSLLALLPISLALPDNEVELGYLKCVSAVIKTTHFPECTSSYKLDCFCEAAGGGSRSTSSSGIIASTPGNRAWVYQLPPETEEICASFGVPRDQIPKYLCDDDAVPVSPRRGSTPMGRVEKPLPDCEEREDGIEESSSGEMAKRSIPLEGPRLLIPEHEPSPTAPAPETDDDTDVDEKDEEDEEKDRDQRDGRVLDEKKHAVYEVVTVTKTETRCSCAEPATVAEDPESQEKTSGALHGTHVAVPTPAPASEEDTETETETERERNPAGASSSVRVPSSPAGTSVVPTGVDAEREEEQGEHKPAEEMFHGGAVSTAFSKSVGVLVGVVAGFVLL